MDQIRPITNQSIGLSVQHAIFHGPVTTTNLNTSLPFPLLSQSSAIWFNVEDPIESFTGRESFLEEIHTSLQNGRLTVLSQIKVISGLGGIGKTQTARKYIQMYRNHYKNIIWINAETCNEIQNSFLSLAQKHLNISVVNPNGEQKPMDEWLLHRIYENLCRNSDSTLIIFDNAEKFRKNGIDVDAAIEPFLPRPQPPPWKNPCILVTSRNSKDWGKISGIFTLSTFNDEETINFVVNQLNLDLNEESQMDAVNLGQILGGLPLALQQAVAYIQNENEKSNCEIFTIKNYIEKFQEHRQIKKLIKYPMADCPSSDSHITVDTTWNISLEKMKNFHDPSINEVAIEIIQMLSFLDPDNVSRQLLIAIVIPDSNFKEEELEEKLEEFEEALKLLKKYSMINVIKDNSECYITIHRIVQLVIFERLRESPLKIQEITINLVERLDSFLKRVSVVHPNYRGILNNLICLTNKFEWMDKPDKILLEFQSEVGMRFQKVGLYDQSMEILKKLEKVQKMKSASKQDLAKTWGLIGTVWNDKSFYEKAIAVFEKALQVQSRILGENHKDFLTTKNHLGIALKNQYNYNKSLKVLEEVYKVREIVLGDEHYDSLITQNAIAVVLKNLERFDEALVIYKKVYEIRERNFGPTHVDTLTTLDNMAVVFEKKGQMEKALKLYEKVLKIRENVLGSDHPDFLGTMHNLGRLYDNLGQFEKSIEIYEKVYKKRNLILGKNHFDTLTTRGNMARVLGNQKKFQQAFQVYQEVYEIKEKVLVKDHRDSLAIRHNQARLLNCQGKLEESLVFYEEVRIDQEKWLGMDHPDTLNTKHNMGMVLEQMNRPGDAIDMFQEVLKSKKLIFGIDHPSTLSTENSLRRCFKKLKLNQD